jgi:hypothetical protein
MLGGAYLCFRRVPRRSAHWVSSRHHDMTEATAEEPCSGEADRTRISKRQKVKGAIKTDFILSAEIMTITLAALPDTTQHPGWWAARWPMAGDHHHDPRSMASVALIVKADDVGPASGFGGTHRRRARGWSWHRAGDARLHAHADHRRHAWRCSGWAAPSSPMRWPASAGTGRRRSCFAIAHAARADRRVSRNGWLPLCPAWGAGDLAIGMALIPLAEKATGARR